MSAHFEAVLTALGPATPEVTSISRIQDGTWAVGYGEHAVIVLDLQDADGRVVLTTPVGRAPEDVRAQVYESLLAYNALWHETGGVRMALAGDTVLQIASIGTEGLEMEGLQNVLRNCLEKALIWRRYLETATPDADAAALPPGMRV